MSDNADFGIIDVLDKERDYSKLEVSYKEILLKYYCISLPDDILSSWDCLKLKTFHHSFNRPSFDLARYGVTLIPPTSLTCFNDIILRDTCKKNLYKVQSLIEFIDRAKISSKYIIHFGI